MRKISIAAVLFSLIIIASCSKKGDDLVLPKQDETNNAVAAPPVVFVDPSYTWEELPADLKNAVIVNPTNTDKNPAESFGPYGNTSGTGFASFPPAGSKIYAMGLSTDNAGLNKIIIWYKGADNKIYYFAAGVATSFHIQKFADDEYINTMDVYINTIVKKISITTNKKTFTYGVTGGTRYGIYSPGSQILAFWGKYATNITQLYAGAYSRTWTLLPGADAHDIAVAADGTAYLTNDAGKIYRFTNNIWQQIVGSDGRTIAANANRVALVNTAGKIYELFGNAWVQLPGSDAKDVAINSDGKIWMVNTAGSIYRYNETSWQLMPVAGLGNFLEHAYRIGAGAGQVYVVTSAMRLYKWNAVNLTWDLQTGINPLDVAVANDGIVWVRANSTVYNFYNNKWTAKGASSVENIAVNNKTAFITQANGSIRNLAY